MTNSEQLFSWHEFGLSLHIPENSLPDNLHQCSIHIKASIMGDYQLPQDTHLVSAVYRINCVPKCQFSEQLTLEIQHCAKQENLSKLCILRAHSKVNNGMFQTINNGSQSGYGVFPHHSSYGFIELNEFCRIGVGQNGSKERKYCASVYYCEEDATACKIHFVIMWNTDTHKRVC